MALYDRASTEYDVSFYDGNYFDESSSIASTATVGLPVVFLSMSTSISTSSIVTQTYSTVTQVMDEDVAVPAIATLVEAHSMLFRPGLLSLAESFLTVNEISTNLRVVFGPTVTASNTSTVTADGIAIFDQDFSSSITSSVTEEAFQIQAESSSLSSSVSASLPTEYLVMTKSIGASSASSIVLPDAYLVIPQSISATSSTSATLPTLSLIRSGAIDPSSVAQVSALNYNLIVTKSIDYNSIAGITLTSNNITVIPFTPSLYGFDDIINTSNLVPVIFYIPTSGTASVVSLPSAVSASFVSESTSSATASVVSLPSTVNASSVNEATTTVTSTTVNVQ
jgi:hypothetical protein